MGYSRRRHSLTSKDISRLFRVRYDRLCAGIMVRQKGNGLSYSRLAVNIRRRDYRRAVDRNRIRRLIYEAFRRDGLQKGKDYLVQVGLVPANGRFSVVARTLTAFWGD